MFGTSKLLNINDATKRIGNFFKLPIQLFHGVPYPELALIGTSALAGYDIDGAVGMYSGVFNNPFMIWGRYRKRWFRTYLTVSFQFHHTQMDGAHAARFLDLLQAEIQRCGQTE